MSETAPGWVAGGSSGTSAEATSSGPVAGSGTGAGSGSGRESRTGLRPAAVSPAEAVCASGTPMRAKRSGISASTGALRRHARPYRAWSRA